MAKYKGSKKISQKLWRQATESRLRLLRGGPKVESYGGMEKATSRLRLRAAHRGIAVHPAVASTKVSRSARRGQNLAKRAPLRSLASKESGIKTAGRSNVAKSFAKATGKHFAKFATSGAGKAISTVAKRAGPIGLAYGAVAGAISIGKAGYQGAKAVSAYRDLDIAKKKSKSKYGTLAAAARTRKEMTGNPYH